MADILRVFSVFVLIVLLLRKRLSIGLSMLIGAGALSALYLMPPRIVLSTIYNSLTSEVTIKLLIALTSIKVFELILRERNVLAQMMDASKGLLRNKKAIVISMPLLIGMLPSVGGAYFSAPMVEESAKGTKTTAEERGFINYWYRHPWEYILPLYPGVVLASLISGLDMRRLIVLNLPSAVMLAITGFFFGLRNIEGTVEQVPELSKKVFINFLPLVAIIVLVAVFKVELHWALIASVVVLFLVFRYRANDIFRALRHGLELDVILLIAGVMIFKEMMEASGAVKNISIYFREIGVALIPTLFFLPFMTGLLTGLTVGFVGSTFPLILSLLGKMNLSLLEFSASVSFAFVSGYMGVLFSPVHVCFILTRQYFKADLLGMYKKIIPAGLIVLALGLIQYLVLRAF